MNPLLFGAILAGGLGLHDVNTPGELRLGQDLQIPVYTQETIAIRRYPWASFYVESAVWLHGNRNPPLGAWPHAPIFATWGLGLRIDRGWWYLDAGHTSFHVVPSPVLFGTRQWSGLALGFRFGENQPVAPHVVPGL